MKHIISRDASSFVAGIKSRDKGKLVKVKKSILTKSGKVHIQSFWVKEGNNNGNTR